MVELLEAAKGAGPYFIVFIGMAGALVWLNTDRGRLLKSLEKSNERLLEERARRADESRETASLLEKATERMENHSRLLEKVLDRWNSSRV